MYVWGCVNKFYTYITDIIRALNNIFHFNFNGKSRNKNNF